jgi:hypothetical protein
MKTLALFCPTVFAMPEVSRVSRKVLKPRVVVPVLLKNEKRPEAIKYIISLSEK